MWKIIKAGVGGSAELMVQLNADGSISLKGAGEQEVVLGAFDQKRLLQFLQDREKQRATADNIIRAIRVAVESSNAESVAKAIRVATIFTKEFGGKEALRDSAVRTGYDCLNILGLAS